MGKYLEKLQKQASSQQQATKVFATILGTRLAGKTTVAGTLPGTTLLLHGGVLEAGTESARLLAERNKANLIIVEFNCLAELKEHLRELRTDTDIDNVFVDGVSVISEMKLDEVEIKGMVKKDPWGAYRLLGDDLRLILTELKKLSMPEAAKPKNVFITTALKVKLDNTGAVVDVDLEVKGNVAVEAITKMCPNVVTIVQKLDEKGNRIRQLLTKKVDHFPARIGSILDEDCPVAIEADLKALLKLINKK